MVLDKPAKAFVEFGIPRREAKALSRLLRGPATTSMRWLLLDVEYSSAPGTLILAQTILTPVLPGLTRDLVPRMVGMESEPNWANAAAIPLLWLEAMNYELLSLARANLARAGSAAMQPPRPSSDLAKARRDLDQRSIKELADHAGQERAQRVKSQLGEQLRNRIDNSIQQGSFLAQAWTGWALLAAMRSLEIVDSELPNPGRGERGMRGILAFTAYRTGQALITAAAMDLIDTAERAL